MMIKYIAVLAFVITLGQTTTVHLHKIHIKTGDEHKLKPKIEDGPAESNWDLETCDGCKIVITCTILSPTCDDHLLTIFDGLTEHQHCGPERWSIMHTSYQNKMNVSIKTTGLRSGSYCRIRATKPYTNDNYVRPDSAEYGTGTGATRNTSCRCGWRNNNQNNQAVTTFAYNSKVNEFHVQSRRLRLSNFSNKPTQLLGNDYKAPARIIGGDITSTNEYPFVVLIMLKNSEYAYCGGSIITRYHVLTAAHCTFPYQRIQLAVIVGEHNRNQTSETSYTKVIEVERTIHHPKYDHGTNVYDISVMLLRESVEISDAVGPVCLPNFKNRDLIDEYVKVMGWGRLRTSGKTSEVLRHVNLKVIDPSICATVYSSFNEQEKYQFCTWAPQRDSCQGDSGGPLVWKDPETNRYVQVGVVSFGRECGGTDPAVNSDVAYFLDWIKKMIQEPSPQEICV